MNSEQLANKIKNITEAQKLIYNTKKEISLLSKSPENKKRNQ